MNTATAADDDDGCDSMLVFFGAQGTAIVVTYGIGLSFLLAMQGAQLVLQE